MKKIKESRQTESVLPAIQIEIKCHTTHTKRIQLEQHLKNDNSKRTGEKKKSLYTLHTYTVRILLV